MGNVIDKIANGETLTAEDWEMIDYVLEDDYGWDKDHGDEEERIWHFILVFAKEKLEDFNLGQLLEVIGY